MIERVRARLAGAVPQIRRHGFWLALPVATAAVVAAAILTASAAAGRSDAWRERHEEARSTDSVLEGWERGLVPPAAEESAAWRASARSARDRGIEAADRVALMHAVAERAEGLGVADVRVGFIRSDTIQPRGVREVSGDIFELAPYALWLRFRSDYPTVARVIGGLPPQVDVHRVELHEGEGDIEADLVLLVYLGVDS
jgi:hypothetical protein